jgi:hypothetical protein
LSDHTHSGVNLSDIQDIAARKDFLGGLFAGATDQLRIGTDGDLDRIKDVPYSWPAANATGVLFNDGVGNLAWTLTPAGLDADTLDGIDSTGFFILAGQAGGQIGHGGTATLDDLIFRSNVFAQNGRIILGDDITKPETVVIHGTEQSIQISGVVVDSRLTIHDQDAVDANLVIHKHHDTGTVTATMLGARSRGTEAAETVVVDNDILLRILAVGYDGADFERAAQILFEVDDATPSGTSMGGALVFSTTAAASVTLTERLRVAATGRVSVAGSGFSVNALNYVWPAAQGASTVLTNDGAGTLTWATPTTGTVTSVAGGVGITNSPEPIVGAGTVDLDINSLTSETTLASGDLFAFVDVSVGATIAAQRKVTLSNIAVGLNALTDPFSQYTKIAGRTGTTNDTTLSTSGDGTLLGSSAAGGALILDGGPHSSGNFHVKFVPTLTTTSGVDSCIEAGRDITWSGGILNVFTMSEHGDWLVTTNYTSLTGGRAMVVAPNVFNDANRSHLGVWQGFYDALAITAVTGTTISDCRSLPFSDFRFFNSFDTGTLTVSEHTTLSGLPTIGAGATITTRRGLRWRNKAGAGTQETVIAVDHEAQTFTTLAAALRSAQNVATGAWCVLSTGTADSSFAGRIFVGGASSTVPVVDLDVDGDFATRSANVALANGANSNIAIGARSFVHITGPTAAFTTTGFASGFDGKRLVVKSTVNQTWTITNDATSTAANRIYTVDGADVVLAAGGGATDIAVAEFVYSATASRWILIAARDTAGPR